MRFQCSHCHGILAIDDGEPGEAVECGHCSTAVAIPQTRLSSGAIVGDFIIRERLGEGGMGTVFLAHQISLDRAAAVKVLHGRYGADGAYIEDFVREARAAAAINHPNIVQAYAVGEDEGLFYFAMEYVRGSTLKQVLTHGGRIVPDRALDIAIQVAGALDFAWRSQGLVHRDIKPDNIILTGDGSVKLADLGLARKMADTASDGTQELYGTPQYIAPEHLLGSRGDNRSDIYSLGATLFHALSGHFPFEGASPAEIAQKHLSEPLPPIRDICPDVPPALAQVISVTLAKRPRHRYQDAAVLLADLEAVRQGLEPSAVLDPEAQRPIDLYGEEADAIVAERLTEVPAASAEVPATRADTPPHRRRLSVSKNLPAGARPAATAAEPAAPAAPVAPPPDFTGAVAPGLDEVGAEVPEEEPPASRRGPFLLGVAVLVLLLGAGAGYFWWQRRAAATAAGGGGGELGPDATASAGVAAALQKVQAEIAAGRPASEIRGQLEGLVTEFGYDHAESEALVGLLAPYLEADLEKARQPLYEAERQQWEELGTAAKARLAAEAEKAKLEAEAEAARQKKAAEESQVAAAKAVQEAEVNELKKTVRVQAAELCRKHQFDEASVLFVPLTTREGEIRRWAESRRSGIAMAEALFESVVNSKDQLAGVALAVPGQPKGDWRVSRIGFRDVELQARRVTYVKGQREEEMDSVEIPFAELTPPQLDKLTEKKWELDGRNEAERKLWFGAYLLAREQYIGEARKRLEACGRDEAAALLAELATVEPEIRQAEFAGYVEQAKHYLQQGDKQRARQVVEYLQREFAAEAEQAKDELRDLMGEP